MTAYDLSVLADSPLWYPLLDDTLADWADDSGSADWSWRYKQATVNQTAVVSDGGKSVASSLGSGGTIAYKAHVPASLSGPNMSAAIWVNVPAGNYVGSMWELGDGALSNGWGIGIGNASLVSVGRGLLIFVNGLSWGDTGYSLPTGVNHIVVARGSGISMVVYVNGTAIYTGNMGATPGATQSIMRLGNSLSTGINIDNVAVFSSQLSGAQVTAQYNGGAGSNSAIAAANPVIWLKADETSYSTSAQTVADSSGNGRTMTLNNFVNPGGAPPVAGMGGKSISFFSAAAQGTGGHSYGYIPSPSWAQTLNALTCEVWFRSPANTGVPQVMMALDDVNVGPTSTLRKFLCYIDGNGKLTFQDYTTAGGTPYAQYLGLNVCDNNWHHVGMTRDSTDIKIFLDGNTTPVATGSVGGTHQTASTGDLLLGATRYNQPNAGWTFRGELSHPALYGTALAPARLAAHYAAASAPSTTPGYWGIKV